MKDFHNNFQLIGLGEIIIFAAKSLLSGDETD